MTPTAISAGGYHSLAIGSDGKLYAWGSDEYGQLGDGTMITTGCQCDDSPQAITLAPAVTPTTISAGDDHSLAIGSDGKLYAWGDNKAGQLGDGTTTSHDSPEVVTLAPGVTPTAISAGVDYSLAIGSDGNLYAWGWNYFGQLGDGTTISTGCQYDDSPEVITLAAGATPSAISAGGGHSLAIGSAGVGTSLPETRWTLALPIIVALLLATWSLRRRRASPPFGSA